MISVASKKWILKFFDLVQKEEIKIELPQIQVDTQQVKNLLFIKSGIPFGFVSKFIFIPTEFTSKWTQNEKLTFLLFESQFCVYVFNRPNWTKDDFINDLLDFYEHYSTKSISKLFTFFLKEKNFEKLEKILEKRTDIHTNLIDSNLWVSYLSNTFVYLDVILFDEFLRTKRTLEFSNYENYALEALKVLILAAQADGIVEEKELKMFNLFLASAKISDKQKEEIEDKLKQANDFNLLNIKLYQDELFKRYILTLSVLTIYSNHTAGISEKEYLNNFSYFIGIDEHCLNETLVLVENFVLKHNHEISFLQEHNSVEKLLDNVSKRWIKILGRNKDKLAQELKQSKDLVFLIKKSTQSELSKEEKERVKTQFLDLVKTMPALAIFMLPGGAILLPIILKIIPDLIPSAFRENEIN
ncbi:MAG: TerB family tellurite resistance protein [Flavobacteriia bacterium]|nr:TerB family tellurite resistance protein [Flavobacteriia bacterium]